MVALVAVLEGSRCALPVDGVRLPRSAVPADYCLLTPIAVGSLAMRKRSHDWARVGAEHRLRELQAEMDAIVATFPFLGKLRRKIGKVVKANAPRPRKT